MRHRRVKFVGLYQGETRARHIERGIARAGADEGAGKGRFSRAQISREQKRIARPCPRGHRLRESDGLSLAAKRHLPNRHGAILPDQIVFAS